MASHTHITSWLVAVSVLSMSAMAMEGCKPHKVTDSVADDSMSRDLNSAPLPQLDQSALAEDIEEAHTSQVIVDHAYFKQMSAAQVVEWLSYNRLRRGEEDWDTFGELPAPFDITDREASPVTDVLYTGVGSLPYLVHDISALVYTHIEELPRECMNFEGEPNYFDVLNNSPDCKRFVYNEFIRIKYDRALFEAPAKLDPKTLSLVLNDLDEIDAHAPMLGHTARQVYQAIAPAVHDYLLVWQTMSTQRKSMYARYKKALKTRGVLPKGSDDDDMISFYDDLNEGDMPEVEGLHDDSYVHTIIGFWMRRMDDGTAEELVSFMTRSEQKFGK